jgi:UDP-N-acetylglucosamine transferase subunit ALG13
MQEKLSGSMAAMKEMAFKQDSRINDLNKNIVVSVCGDGVLTGSMRVCVRVRAYLRLHLRVHTLLSKESFAPSGC